MAKNVQPGEKNVGLWVATSALGAIFFPMRFIRKDQKIMTPSRRIALNTAATYARSVFSLALGLFSSRWVLGALGQTDFGLFSVVGSLIVFIVFLNGIMAGSAGRHYAYAIGQGNPDEVKRWFNAAFSIHLCLALGLIVAGWPIGEYVIAQHLTVPPGRLPTCLLVFRISLASTFFGMVSVPFIAMFTAKQHIAEVALWGLVQSVLYFSFAWCLPHISGDLLMIYAVGMAAISIFIQIVQVCRAASTFHECGINLRYWFDRSRLQEIFSFAVWNLIGSLGAVLRNQGSAILLNIYFGPKVNAAYGIANQVSTHSNQLSTAMMGAFYPEITVSEGRGDRARMLDLSLRACKLGTILALLFAVPLMAEMNYVLKLWLIEPPAHTSLFCRLILSTFLIDRLTFGYMMAVNAHGRIAAYQATLGTTLLMTLPLAWLFLHSGYAPTSVGIAFVITMGICSLGRVLWTQRLFGIPAGRWITGVVMPCVFVAASGTLGAAILRWFLPASFARIILSSMISLALSLVSTWFFALDNLEKKFICQSFERLINKLSNTRILNDSLK